MPNSLSTLFRSPDICDLITGPLAKPGPELDFYLKYSRQAHGPVLDLGCGTGRLTIPLAQYGCNISGLDLSPEMLKRAEEKAVELGLEIYWVQEDFRRLSSVRRFGLILMSSDTVNLMKSRFDFESLFHGVMAHLQPDGLFVFSIVNPNLQQLSKSGKASITKNTHLTDDKTNQTLKSQQSHHYDVINQQLQHKLSFHWDNQDPFLDCNLNMRCLFPDELNNLLHYNGFEIVERYGDYEGSDFEPTSSRQVIVAKPRLR